MRTRTIVALVSVAGLLAGAAAWNLEGLSPSGSERPNAVGGRASETPRQPVKSAFAALTTESIAPTSTSANSTASQAPRGARNSLLTKPDLAALYASHAGLVSGESLAIRAHIMQQCADAARPERKSLSLSEAHMQIPPDAPYADRREQARQRRIAMDWVRRCGKLLDSPASADQIRAAFVAAANAGSEQAAHALLQERIAASAKIKVERVEDGPFGAPFERRLSTAPDGASTKELVQHLASTDALVKQNAFATLGRFYTDKVLALDGELVRGQELGWAWRLVRCEAAGDCGQENPWLSRSCLHNTDACRHNSVEAAAHAEHSASWASLRGAEERTDWARVMRLRDALQEAENRRDYSRLGFIDRPQNGHGYGYGYDSSPRKPFDLFGRGG